jgi:hypothetical protein
MTFTRVICWPIFQRISCGRSSETFSKFELEEKSVEIPSRLSTDLAIFTQISAFSKCKLKTHL